MKHTKQPEFTDAEFPSQGVTLRGRLYAHGEGGGLQAAVVMSAGFSATITMIGDKYAEVFADAAFVVLLFDQAGFGSSDGERQIINPWLQARSYLDAVTYVQTIPGVDPSRIAIMGASLAGGLALVVAALDERVAAVAAQVPICGPVDPPNDPDGQLFAALRDTLFDGDITGSDGTRVGPLPVVSADQLGTPSLLQEITAFRWFIDRGARHGTGWQNVATRVTPRTAVPLHPGLATPHLRAPSLWVLAPTDEIAAANPVVARSAYENAGGEKQLVEIGGGHFGALYWPSELFDLTSSAELAFLNRVLKTERKS